MSNSWNGTMEIITGHVFNHHNGQRAGTGTIKEEIKK